MSAAVTLPSWRTVLRWALLVVILAAVTAALLAIALANTPRERTTDLVIVPHPDDEFQVWSLLEQRPDEEKLFLVLTQGEESGFCEPDVLAAALQDDLGELPPEPEPEGRWTAECEEARRTSLLGYLSQMSLSDPTVPGDFSTAELLGPLPAEDTEICRIDDGVTRCDESLREVRVHVDRDGRGGVVFFDLGDGDLTPEETAWAIRSVIEHRAEWGFGEHRIASVMGAFANDQWPCFSYPHPDHIAVHEALWSVDFDAGPQLAATCFLDPRQRMSVSVDQASVDASFEIEADGTRVGAHGRHYGWLHAAAYPVTRLSQSTLFQSFQSFWIRFN